MQTLSWSEVANVILGLLTFFQWYRYRAREEATRELVLASRRIVMRNSEPKDAVDVLDATLATLGARNPFVEWGDRVLKFLRARSEKEKNSELFPITNVANKDVNPILSPIQIATENPHQS